MENIKKDTDLKESIKKILESRVTVKILYGIGIVIIAMLIFYAGITVGFRKASFGHAWGENYERNFGMMQNRSMFGQNNFPNANGAIGKIIKITLPTIIVQDRDNIEKVVLMKNDTQIQKLKENITTNDLKIDDFVVVIGTPNEQGQIEAKFIRIMPLGMPVPSSAFGQPSTIR